MGLSKGASLSTVAVFCAMAAGCCKEYKQRIFQLESQYNDLANRNKELQDQLTAADLRADELGRQLDQKNIELGEKDAEIAKLKSRLAAGAVADKTPAKGWRATPLGDMVSVAGDILFPSGRATLTRRGMIRLEQIAEDIKRTYPGLRVRVYGHTDSDPIKNTRRLWQDNLDLSANRAMAVTRYLVKKGVPAERIESIAMGEHHPVAANQGPGKARNRRVEIVVVRDR